VAFKLKDLIIDVLHRDKAGLLCGPATKPEAGLLCGPATKPDGLLCGPATKPDGLLCGPATKPEGAARICGPATIGDALARICGPATLFDGLHAEDLATLKRQLEEALARVRESTPEEHQTALPQSLAEVEDLENKLQGALDELREHKKGLT
jgi:hypothetical protein